MAQKKQKYNKTKFYLTFAVVVALLAGIAHLWDLSPLKKQPSIAGIPQTEMAKDSLVVEEQVMQEDADEEEIPDEEEAEEVEDAEDPENMETLTTSQDTLTYDSSYNVFLSLKVWSYPECFNDSNAVQLVAAERNGIRPVETRDQLMELVGKNKLTDISTSPYYIVEDLTHSMPYLVPKAQLLLNTIGINFVDSLHSKGYPLHIPVVTSVLRTAHDIKNLQRGNVNSVTNSCHCYGTTIDITYNRFMPLEGTDLTRYDDNLKKVLAEVLFDLKAEDRCYVKYERLQACFHLTVR